MPDVHDVEGHSNQGARSIWTISIVSSVVASAVFFMFFQPILLWLSKVVTSGMGAISSRAVDMMYEQSAMGMERGILGYIATAIFVVLINASLFPVILVVVKKIRGAQPSTDEEKSDGPTTSRFVDWYSIFSSCVAFLGFLYVAVGVFVGVQASTTFDRYMRASAPYLTVEQEERIHAQWALMQTRSDYNLIINNLEKSAEEGQWELPKRLL